MSRASPTEIYDYVGINTSACCALRDHLITKRGKKINDLARRASWSR